MGEHDSEFLEVFEDKKNLESGNFMGAIVIFGLNLVGP